MHRLVFQQFAAAAFLSVLICEEAWHFYHVFTVFIALDSVFMLSVELGLNLAGYLKMFWNRESDFYCGYCGFMSSYSSLFICLSLSDHISILPQLSLCLSLIQCRQLLLPPSQTLTLFCPSSSSLCLSLSDPLKWDPIMFFPSCSPPTLRWGGEPPAGGIKDMIYRAPSQTKKRKRKKKTLNERSVFQHSSFVLQCRFHSSKFWLEIWQSGRDTCGLIFVRLQKRQNGFPQ